MSKDQEVVNLILAIIWSVIGGYLLVDAWNHPDGKLGAMPGFVALALAAYNVVRWWAARQLNATRRDENGSPIRPLRRSAEANDHLFRLEDEPIPLPPPNTHIQAATPSLSSPPPEIPPGSDRIKE